MADKSFEKKVSIQMEEFKIRPSDTVWKNVEVQLRKNKRRRRFIIFSISASAVLVGLFIYMNKPASNSSDQAVQQNNPPLQYQPGNAINDKKQTLTTATGFVKKKDAVADPVIVKNKQQTTSIKKPANIGFPVIVKNKKPGVIKKQSTLHPVITDRFTDKKSSDKNELVIAGKIQPSVQDTIQGNRTDSNRVIQNESMVTSVPVHLKDSNAINPPVVQKSKTAKKKWQYGFMGNVGAGNVSNSRFGQLVIANYNSGTGAGVVPGISPGVITTKEYKANKVAQFGFGFTMRKEIFRNGFFSTGLQYQQTGFRLEQKQKSDSLVIANNTWVNFSTSVTEKNYRYHYINIPTELQLGLVQNRKTAITFTAGIHHNLGFGNNLAAKRNDTLLYFLQPRYALTPSVDMRGSKVAFYQPVFYLSPAYNLAGKKSILQIGLYVQYGFLQVYRPTPANYWWQTGINFRYYFNTNQ